MGNDPKIRTVSRWINLANNDLKSATKLATPPDSFLETVLYHCQQSAEKAIKAFLVYNDEPIEKTHDIEALIQKAAEYNVEFFGLDRYRLRPKSLRNGISVSGND